MKNNPIRPNFLIIGAAKSGTTALYEYLRLHPDVFMPDWKEPAFFAPPEAGGVQDETTYLNLFEKAEGHPATGEASVAYLYAPEAAPRIAAFLGTKTKLIVLLRNPVDMAYSNWAHQRRQGYENMPFDLALQKEKERLADPSFFQKNGTWAANLAYRARALYRPQLERYLSLFPRENIRIYLYEEFFKPDLPLWQDLCVFLGIGQDFHPPQKRHNAGWQPRFHALQAFLHRPSGIKNVLKMIIPTEMRHKLKTKAGRLNRSAKSLPPLDPALRRRLEEDFSDDVRWLEQFLERDLKPLWF